MTKYHPLSERLRTETGPEWSASFSEIEAVLGFPLPKGARAGRTWWTRAEGRPHARAWMDAGFEAQVDLARNLVTFRRATILPAPEVQPPAMLEAAEAASQDMHRTRAVGGAAIVGATVAGIAGVAALTLRLLKARRS
ncbi:hypothetical protein [Phenylobacterium sp.]|jgi:hypothetical protein|uniref:DUF7662 domain-containing protein n=1 Tax=Phenylobacterium sp. TaxID=1871053 RepID=UPI003783A184